MTALFSFLGSSIFRLIFGEIIAAWNKRQEHAHEMARMQMQAQLEAAQHERNQAAIRLQAELGVQTIRVQSEARGDELDGLAFLEGVKATTIQTGIKIVDAWNAVIRPGCATWAIFMLTAEAFTWFGITQLGDGTREVISAALGLFLADRSLARRGKR